MSNVHVPPVGGQFPTSSSSDSEESSKKAVDLPPQLAIRSDGVFLLSTRDMANRDLSGRTVWTCIDATPDEAAQLRLCGVNVEQEVASKLIAKLPRKPSTHH